MSVTLALRNLHEARDILKKLPKDAAIEEALNRIGQAIAEINEVWGNDDAG